ncbi:MAG: gamma-glutamyltransferase [archaeon]|nr:gamma-glutamyltransferase [archaeon]
MPESPDRREDISEMSGGEDEEEIEIETQGADEEPYNDASVPLLHSRNPYLDELWNPPPSSTPDHDSIGSDEELVIARNTRHRQMRRSHITHTRERIRSANEAFVEASNRPPSRTGNDNGNGNGKEKARGLADHGRSSDSELGPFSSGGASSSSSSSSKRKPRSHRTKLKKAASDVTRFCWDFRWQWLVFVLTILGVILVGILDPYPTQLSDGLSDPSLYPPQAQATSSSRDVVTTDVSECSAIGAFALNQWQGTAVDAVVAAAFCLGVMAPQSAGLGGGGVMMLRFEQHTSSYATDTETLAIDCRETAPLNATRGMFGSPPVTAQAGPLSVATPAQLWCLWEAHQRYGRLPWVDLLRPSISLARNFTVNQALADALNASSKLILASPSLSHIFAPSGRVLTVNQTGSNPALAETLRLISTDGPAALYGGLVGQRLVNDIEAVGGILTLEDLESYRVEVSEPVGTFFQGYQVYAPPPPFSGPVLNLALNLLENYNPALVGNNVVSQHQLIEALKFAFADRAGLGDPNFVPGMWEYVANMSSKEHAAAIRSRIISYSTFPAPYYVDLCPLYEPLQAPVGGTHLNALQKGTGTLAVSFSSSIGPPFGSLVLSNSTGILLNANMQEFAVTTRTNDPFFYNPAPANYIEPGKRPLSAMTPVIVTQNNEFLLALGASGDTSIAYAILEVLLNFLAFGSSLQDAVSMPRFFTPFIPENLFLEIGFSALRVSELSSMQYPIDQLPRSNYLAVCHAVSGGENPTSVTGAADRRMPDSLAIANSATSFYKSPLSFLDTISPDADSQ